MLAFVQGFEGFLDFWSPLSPLIAKKAQVGLRKSTNKKFKIFKMFKIRPSKKF